MDVTRQVRSRVLYIYPGVVPPESDSTRNKHSFLSQFLSGDVLLPVWWKSQEEIERRLAIAHGDTFTVGNFQYHFFPFFRYPPIVRTLAKFCFYLFSGLSIFFRGEKYGVIVSYGSNTSGIAALLLHWMTGAKLVLEVPGVPNKIFQYEEARTSIFPAIKQRVSDVILSFLLRFTDYVKLLFPEQLDAYSRSKGIPRIVFHEFVPVASLRSGEQGLGEKERFLLFLGYPWYLKGVDILIQAFQLLSPEFPELSLKIVGACADRAPYEKLRAGNERIQFSAGVTYQEAMDLMNRCFAFVLPSRTEAMGRVLVEAMAMGKAVIASRVDGIPYYVQDGENGLLFESENASDLASKVRRLLVEDKLAETLGERGRELARENLNEQVYARKFQEMMTNVFGVK